MDHTKMNERIRELMEQAFREADGKRISVMEKFAELIVQECIDIANLSNTHGNNQWDKALTFAVNTIKENFGVK